MDFKQVILVRTDLKMPKGKIAAQASHASIQSMLKANEDNVLEWRREGMKKVVLKVQDKEELFKYYRKANSLKLPVALIKDAGKTFFKNAEYTCLGIGPDREDRIDKVTKDLKML